MGRFRATSTMQVYAFEGEWKQFSKAPHKATREAFGELVAMAHFQAAALAHAASTHVFEMILLTMVMGTLRRAEELEMQGVLSEATNTTASGDTLPLQTNLWAVMHVLRQRLSEQKHELYTFARALRRQDQRTLRTLLTVTQAEHALVPQDAGAPSDEMLLTLLIGCMRRIRRLEKQHQGRNAIVSLEEWSGMCTAT
jgi:hypothetical protein